MINKVKKRSKINFLLIIHLIQTYITLFMQFVKVVIIVSVFIIGRLDFEIKENLEFDYEDITLSFGTYKDTYLINRIVEMNLSDQIEEEPIIETTTSINLNNDQINTENLTEQSRLDFNLTYEMPDIYIDDTPLTEKLRFSYNAYLIYFLIDLINNILIFYSLERKHFKSLFIFQLLDLIWILLCHIIKFYCCLIESLLFKVFVILPIAIFILIEFTL